MLTFDSFRVYYVGGFNKFFEMKKYLVLVLALIMVGTAEMAHGQIRKRSLKKNNKRISKFKGRKNNFTSDKKYNFVAVSINALNYFGDLAPLSRRTSTDISFTRPGVGIVFGHRFGPRYTLRASFMYGTLRGDDFESADPNDQDARFRYVRNLHFRNRIKELAVTAMFDLFENEGSYISRVQFTPYIFAGLAVFHHNPQAIVPDTDRNGNPLPGAGDWVDLQPLGTEGQHTNLPTDAVNSGISEYSLWQIAIPAGLGVRYRLNQVFDLSFEMSFRYTFTDYLDDVSQNYVDTNIITASSEGDNAVARALADRSWEPTAVVSGSARDFEAINATASDRNGDGFFNGYGTESRNNIRGNADDNDLYFVTSIKVAYIIGATFRRAKFR